MSRDFNAFDSTGNAFRDSGYNARGRNALFFGAAQSGGAINFPAGIIGDSLQFYAYSPTFPFPTFAWNGGMIGEPDEGWGRRSFTIRHWWRAGDTSTLIAPYGSAIWGDFFIGAWDTYQIRIRSEEIALAVPVGPITKIVVPKLEFRVVGASTLGVATYHFTQSPNTAGGAIAAGTGTIGPLIEMAEDTWHRTIAWYDADALEIGLQLDDLAPVTAALSGPIPPGPDQSLQVRDSLGTPVNNWDLSFDEYGLWHDYVWTSGERLADWNAGAGIGWPDVLTTISKRPMAYWRFEDPDDNEPEGIASLI